MKMKLLGYTEEVTVCDCCGKSNLACTVALETEIGEIVHYGRTCAALAMLGSKNAKNVSIIENRARAMNKVAPVIEAVRSSLPGGIESAKEAGKVAAKGIWINGGTILVSGFASWGKINIDWIGGRAEVAL
jgi:hypothetical protein